MNTKLTPSLGARFYLLTLSLLFLTHCGRKNNNFLNFDAAKHEPKINKLTLPSVKGVRITQTTNEQISLAWKEIEFVENTDDTPPKQFLGYNVYRFARSAFIPKKPLRKKGLCCTTTKTFFHDTTYLDVFEDQGMREPETQPICYAVRPVFKVNSKIIEGTTSKIVCTTNAEVTNLENKAS